MVMEEDRFDGLLLGLAQQCHGIDNLLEVSNVILVGGSHFSPIHTSM